MDFYDMHEAVAAALDEFEGQPVAVELSAGDELEAGIFGRLGSAAPVSDEDDGEISLEVTSLDGAVRAVGGVTLRAASFDGAEWQDGEIRDADGEVLETLERQRLAFEFGDRRVLLCRL